MDITGLAPAAFFAFGAVNAISIFKKDLTSEQKWVLAFIVALLFSFIPADLGTELANRVKDAVAIAIGTSSFAGIANKIGGK